MSLTMMITDDGIAMWQVNCHKSPLVHSEIEAEINRRGSKPLLLLQEQNLKQMYGYNVYQIERRDAKSRACICIPLGLSFTFLEEVSNTDYVSGLLRCENMEVLVVSAYLDGHLPADDIPRKIMDYANSKGIEVLIGCDANARSPLWGCENSNLRGEILLDAMIETGLGIANVGSVPTYVRSNAQSIIDITMHTNGIEEYITDWRVEQGTDLHSDHRLITFNLKKRCLRNCKPTRNLKRANWQKFRKHLNGAFSFNSKHYWTVKDLENEANVMHEIIQQAMDVVAPKVQRAEIDRKPVWQDWKYINLSSKAKAANRRRLKNPSEENLQKYRKYRNQVTSYKREFEAERWRIFCETVTEPKDIAKFAKMKCKRQKLQALKDEQDQLQADPECVVNILRKAHFPGSIRAQSPTRSKDPMQMQRADVYDGPEVTDTVTFEKLKSAIGSFGPYKAAGPDELSPIILQNVTKDILLRYVEMFRASLALSYIPKAWRKANVVFIPKAGKVNYNEVKAFRPITLSSFQLKTLEKLVLWRISEHTLSTNPQSKYQHAFRKNYSTDTALSVVVDKAEQGLLNKEYTLAVFLDIKGAFDNVKQTFVIESMKEKGIENQICLWYNSYLSNRISSITHEGKEVTFLHSRGVPQGGQMSPLTFALCLDKDLAELNSGGARTIAFADDICTLSTSIDLSTAANIVQSKIKILERWAAKAGLEFSVDKTKAMVFTNKRIDQVPKLRLLGNELDFVDDIKYLGVTLTPKLQWNKHIDEKVNACRRTMFMVLNMIRKSFQMSIKGMRWLYTMCVRPKLLYASHIWAGKLTGQQAEKIRKINSLGCRILAPCRRSTPTRTLELIWNLKPLHILARETALATFQRIIPLIQDRVTNNVNARKGHLWTWKSECTNNNIQVVVEKKEETNHWNRSYSVAPFEEKNEFQLLELDDIRYAYTDGSGISGSIGSGSIIRKGQQIENLLSASLGQHNTVYQGELKAIEMVVSQLLDLDPATWTEIRVDNQAVLSRLNSGKASNELENECMKKLCQLGAKTKLTLRWVRAHIGTEGNELADALAKQGSIEADPVVVQLPRIYRKQILRSYTEKLWLEEWKTLIGTKYGHRNSKFWLANPDPKNMIKQLIRADQKQVGLLIAFISGHSAIGEHWSRTNKKDWIQDCRLCGGEPETNEHLLICPDLRHERLLAFGTSDKDQIQKYWNMVNALQFVKNEKVKKVLVDFE